MVATKSDVFLQLLSEITPEKMSSLALERYAQLVREIKIKRQQVRQLHVLFDRVITIDQKLALRVALWSFRLEPKEVATHQRIVQALELMGRGNKAKVLSVLMARLKSSEAHAVKPAEILQTVAETSEVAVKDDNKPHKIPELSIFDQD